MIDNGIIIVIAAVFGFIVGFLLSWAMLQGRGSEQHRERQEVAKPLALAGEERTALRSLRDRQVEPLRDFLSLCGERVAAYSERDYRFGLYEQSPALRAMVSRDAFFSEVTHAINDKGFWEPAMRTFFRATAAAPNVPIRDLLRNAWEDALAAENPGTEAQQTLDRARRAIEDYVVGT